MRSDPIWALCLRAAASCTLAVVACSRSAIGERAPTAGDGDSVPSVDGSDAIDADAGGGCGASACAEGGACTFGRCLVTLARATSPAALAVGSSSAYFASCPDGGGGGTVLGVPVAGGPAVALASGPGCVGGLAVGVGALYVAGLDGADILAVPLDGGPPTVVGTGTDTPVGVAADATNVYWTTAGGAVMQAPATGGGSLVLASSSTRLTRPAVDATSVYWGETTTGIVEKVAIDGGRAALVTSTSLATDLAITGALVVVADGYTLVSAPSAGGPATAIATAAGAPIFAVAADDTSVYFTSYGTIWKVAIDGGPATALASDQDSPGAIAVDQTSVYWTNEGGGQLMKLTPK